MRKPAKTAKSKPDPMVTEMRRIADAICAVASALKPPGTPPTEQPPEQTEQG
jgi:hypothetical protein